MKKLSIITICYNEPNLEKTCESIVNQSWQDFEWIVIDGGSNDETLAIFDRYKSRIDKFVSEPDNGIYNACNKGIKLANGEYLIFMNAGDLLYHKDTLKLFHCFSQVSSAGIYYGECELFKNQNSSTITNYPKYIDLDFFAGNNICMQGMFIRKYLFGKYGLFNEKYKILADYERWLHFLSLLGGRVFCYIPIVVATFDLNGISSTTKATDESKYIISRYFSKEKIKQIKKYSKKTRYAFLKQIFSVRNSSDKCHKVITILNIKLYFKNRYR